MRIVLFVGLLLGLIGCGAKVVPKTKSLVATDEAPPVVMKAAQLKEPGVKFNKVIKSSEGFYEVQGKNQSGKIIEVEVSESGKVLKVE